MTLWAHVTGGNFHHVFQRSLTVPFYSPNNRLCKETLNESRLSGTCARRLCLQCISEHQEPLLASMGGVHYIIFDLHFCCALFCAGNTFSDHDDVIKWKHFPRYWPFVRGLQWRGALMFSLICFWINGWENNRQAGDLRRYRAQYDVIVLIND